MQTVSTKFTDLAIGQVRPLSWGVRASFDKAFDSSATFFTLDTSLLDGIDVLAPTGDNPLQLWDQYAYDNYTDRAISIEVTREETEPYSIVQAYGDVIFNNYDNYFTPNSGSPIENYILPRRPFRLLMGFGGEVVPKLVGLSEKMPEINKTSRTASFHIIDFMSYLLDQDISETIMLEDVQTHEVLDYLFQFMGLLDTQYELDASLNTIPFFFVEKGTKFATVASKLMEAEIGRLYLDDTGVIRFKNRYSYNPTPVYTFNKTNTIDYQTSDESNIINSVKIHIAPREVQALQSVWVSSGATFIPTGGTKEVWAEFSDPVTSVNDPIYSSTEMTDSYFISTLSEVSGIAYTDITVDMELFSKSAKLTFENTGAIDAYINTIDLFGTPTKVIDKQKVEEKDQDSIDKFEEQLYEITDNEYIQDESNAQSRAVILLHDYAEYGNTIDLEVKGSPAIQLGDYVTLDLDGYQGNYVLTKIINIISGGQYTQRLRAREKTVPSFFILDISVLDGTDLLSP